MELEPRHFSRTASTAHERTTLERPPKKPVGKPDRASGLRACGRALRAGGDRVPGDEGRGVGADRAVAAGDGPPAAEAGGHRRATARKAGGARAVAACLPGADDLARTWPRRYDGPEQSRTRGRAGWLRLAR